ncbi:MAG: helix-turn-helix domain-containing protein [Gammaproteobacteria bacterium]|nr:helix-turn-helix domain-containing protein [Gammaproteobacteria bacterium]MCH9717575.1 helix-turn-helix domain-containing protein [Gammaproteobacteria bacterium]MCH9763072.1 helix-turn-helix domain-containing protein [Gammaproteobacteria bacterium]
MITKKSNDALEYISSLTGIKLTLGAMLRAIRQCEHISQVDFSKQLNISRQNLCDIEHGRRFVSPKVAAAYANKLRYPESQFVRLCLQDLLSRDGINLVVDVQKAA